MRGYSSHDPRSFQKIAMVRPSRLVGALLCRSRAGRNCIDPGRQLLRGAATAGVGTVGVVVRAGVDGAVRDDGGVGLVGVAPWGMGWRACRADTFPGAAGAERAVELVVLCMALGSVGIRGHRGAVARAGGHHWGVCEEARFGGVVVGAVSGVGELCGGAQFFGLATQPSGAWLICAADLGPHRLGVAIATICCLMRSCLLLEATCCLQRCDASNAGDPASLSRRLSTRLDQ